MTVYTSKIDSLPNELLIQVLSSFSTLSLLAVSHVSQRFYNVILSILHLRLQAAATLVEHRLILECFHPSAKWTTPTLLCNYVTTDYLSEDAARYRSLEKMGGLGRLSGLYSYFRPVEQEYRIRQHRQLIALNFPGNLGPGTVAPGSSQSSSQQVRFAPSEVINLESHELFAQLCTVANLIKVSPIAGLLMSRVTVGQGVIRVWRQWLADHAHPAWSDSSMEISNDIESPGNRDKRILWIGNGRNVGVRLRVIEREELSTPVLQGLGDEPHVSYTLEYEELVIRTSQLLLRVEESFLQESTNTGKAIVFGAW